MLLRPTLAQSPCGPKIGRIDPAITVHVAREPTPPCFAGKPTRTLGGPKLLASSLCCRRCGLLLGYCYSSLLSRRTRVAASHPVTLIQKPWSHLYAVVSFIQPCFAVGHVRPASAMTKYWDSYITGAGPDFTVTQWSAILRTNLFWQRRGWLAT